ncbi:MAG: GtrA family protein [Alphaproteobacteria bacterium]|uniref:GtrA family protein n=1 Tax=Devosia sp. XGJD_8 TaxID=3391187 RepID=UPI001D3655D2|nr:GtrA family protein [Alphaproteobacteria bacterium]MBU1560571.1 GtrA family protein [Alphaproteobacteria bacterium]MBU2301397.1 GtrA family protein [Alphaproteobacteria bacterium]MBU2367350.1 GtrA family protein [Alphaproteobacteria bacterium]
MSASLESLMREVPRASAPQWGGLLLFIAIGGAGAAAFVVLSTLIIWLDTGIADWIVNTICYGVLIVPVYLLHRLYSFQSEASHWQALPRYLAVQGMALLLAALFSFVIHGVTALPSVVVSILVIALTSGVNFMVLRGWAFARAQWGVAVPA